MSLVRKTFEIGDGREHLKDIPNFIVANENKFVKEGAVIVADRIRNQDREVYHINGTTMQISYEGNCVPVEIIGEESQIQANRGLYERFINKKLIENQTFDYSKVKGQN